MTKAATVQTSGASLSAAAMSGGSARQLARSASTTRVSARTIVETATCPPELKRGDQPWNIADFRVQKMLGEGNMSNVVHCICARSNTHVAVKMYHRDKMNSMNVKQVSREIEIHASLLHPNIVRLYAAFEDADGIYLVQEYASRGDLYVELSRRGGYLPEPQVVKAVLIPFLSALTYMHTQGVLHRDIKPENIMLGADGDIKLGDFGLAINIAREKPMSRVGTLDYMPPEIVRLPYGPAAAAGQRPPATEDGGAAYGLPVDAWCVGVLAYELLVGAPPFEAESKESTYTRIMKVEPVLPGHLSDQARDFIRQSLQKDPSKRPTVHALLRHSWLKAYQRPKSMAVLESPTKAAANAGGPGTFLATTPAHAPSHAAASGLGGTSASEATAAQAKERDERLPSGTAASSLMGAAAGAAAAAAAGEPAGTARKLQSLSFSSALAGRFTDVKPTKPGALNVLRSRLHGAGAADKSAIDGAVTAAAAVAGIQPATSFVPAQPNRRHSSEGNARSRGPSAAGCREGEAPVAAAAGERAAQPSGGKAAAPSVVIQVHAAAVAAARAATAGASGAAEGTLAAGGAAASSRGQAGEDLIRAVQRSSGRISGASAEDTPRGSQTGGQRSSFAAAFRRKLSSVGSGLFGPAGGASESWKDEARAVAVAAAATAALAGTGVNNADPASGPGPSTGLAMGAIAAVQAPSMQQLLAPPRQPDGRQLARAGSLKRSNSGGRFLSALGKKLSIGGGKKSGAGAAGGSDTEPGQASGSGFVPQS